MPNAADNSMINITATMFIKHKQYRDTCLYVMKVFNTGTKYKAKCERWNLGCVNSYDMGIKENVVIEHSDLPNWQWFASHNTDDLRNAEWREFT